MKFFCILCVLCASAVNGFCLDREAFTFTRYDLEVRVEPEQQRVAVRGKLTLRNDSGSPQKNLFLQISSSLDWRSIQVADKPVQFVTQPYPSDIDHTGAVSEAIVSLPQPAPPQGSVELEIGYEGVVPIDTTRLERIGVPQGTARHTDWDQVGKSFTAVRGIGYVVWYPVATESADLTDANSLFEILGRWTARQAEASARFSLCVVQKPVPGEAPKVPYLMMNDPPHNGGSGGGADGTICVEHLFPSLGAQVPSFVVMFDYAVLAQPLLDIYYLPDHKSAAEDYALAAQLAAPFVNEWFGASHQKPQVFELADPQAAPYESGGILFTPLSVSADSRLAQMTAVHQLAHAAFPSPREWIYEGVAHFAQAAYREQQSGRQAALDFMGVHRGGLATVEKSIAAGHRQGSAAAESLINTSIPDLYRSKAMYVWWMLRDMIGEAALKKALAAYRPEQDKDPAYIQRLVAAQSQRDLEWFFDDWVYRDRGLPDFHVESAYPRPTVNGGFVITVSVENLGDAGAEVPLVLHVAGGDITRRLEVRARSKAAIRIEVPSLPREATVNDGSVPESDLSNNAYKIEAPAK